MAFGGRAHGVPRPAKPARHTDYARKEMGRARPALAVDRILLTVSPAETEALAERLGATAEGGEVVGLEGELGAGKTCFVRGLARGLGADADAVASPTFVIATEYRGGRLPLHHVDLYRLERPLRDALFLREVLYGAGVVAVEWFDRLLPEAGDDVLRVALRHGDGDHRTIRLTAHGPRHEAWLARALGTEAN